MIVNKEILLNKQLNYYIKIKKGQLQMFIQKLTKELFINNLIKYKNKKLNRRYNNKKDIAIVQHKNGYGNIYSIYK